MKKFLLLSLVALLAIPASASAALIDNVRGKILLQVEANGEAWYMNPDNDHRYFMGRPADAFNLMRSLGLGITNENLNKIPIGWLEIEGSDRDGDGMVDLMEQTQGTDMFKQDTDGDGHLDLQELLNGYSPLIANGPGLTVDKSLVNRLSGKILLQVESNGSAWYLNPADEKRYFLGRPEHAFAVMRELGLGITNENLETIPTSGVTPLVESMSTGDVVITYPDNFNALTEQTPQSTLDNLEGDAWKHFMPSYSAIFYADALQSCCDKSTIDSFYHTSGNAAMLTAEILTMTPLTLDEMAEIHRASNPVHLDINGHRAIQINETRGGFTYILTLFKFSDNTFFAVHMWFDPSETSSFPGNNPTQMYNDMIGSIDFTPIN